MSVSPKALGRRYDATTKKLFELVGATTHRFTPEGIHDIRVASRRLLVIMKLFPRQVRKSRDFKKFEKALRALLEATSGISDVDTAAKILETFRNVIPPEFFARLAEKRKSLGGDAEAAMSELLRLTPPVLEGSLLGRRRLSARMTSKLKKRERAVKDASRKALRNESAVKELHALRIEIRKLRYLMLLVKNRAKERKALADRQDELGRIHDIDVAMERLKSEPVDHSRVVTLLRQGRHLAYLRFAGRTAAKHPEL